MTYRFPFYDMHTSYFILIILPISLQPREAFEVGWLFVQQYYTFLNKEPAKLHCFYNKRSQLIHGSEGENEFVKHGQQVI
jgi:hypothetical protein